MDPFEAALANMAQETAAGTAAFHWEDDGDEYTLMRNNEPVAGISHSMADAIPGLRAAIESAWDDGNKPN